MGLPHPLIVGELLDAVAEVVSNEPDGIDYDRFKPNPAFAEFLHATLAKHVAQCPEVLSQAKQRRDGFVQIIDARSPPTPGGDVPAADVIGIVAIKEGKPIAYRGMSRYEPLGRNGLMRLDPWLEARFMEEALSLTARPT
jgi:hypothetical protein